MGKHIWPCFKRVKRQRRTIILAINFGRSPVPDDLCKDSTQRHLLFWRRKFLKVFYHIWAWQPFWSMNPDYFSNLSFICPKEAPYEIWATLAKRLQRRSRLKFSTFFPYKMYGIHTNAQESKLDLAVKRSMSMYDHYFNNFGRPPVPDDLCKDSAPRYPLFWRRRF